MRDDQSSGAPTILFDHDRNAVMDKICGLLKCFLKEDVRYHDRPKAIRCSHTMC